MRERLEILFLGLLLALFNALEAGVADIVHHFGEAFGEFVEVLLVEENLVLVKGKGTVPFGAALAFGDRQIEVIVAPCRLHVEEIGPLAGADGLGINVLGIPVEGAAIVVIFVVHTLIF